MKILRPILALVMSLVILLTISPANLTSANSISTDATLNENSEVVSEPVEITALRESNSKTYMLPDGSYQYVGYAEDVHYRKADGSFEEIDNTIVLSTNRANYAYTNNANYWKAYFKESLNDEDAVILVRDNYQISFSMPTTGDSTVIKASEISNLAASLSASKNTSVSELSTEYFETLSADTRAVLYRDVLPGIDVSYTVGTNTLKEDIILKKPTGVNSFSFTVNTGSLSVDVVDNIVSFVDNSGNEVFRLAPLYMVDAAGKRSEELSYSITSNGTKYTLTIAADAAFLSAADTQYPVVIDPSVMVTGASNTYDTCVDQQYPSSNYYLSENLWTGGAFGTNAMRTYIKFDMPSGISASDITSAYLRIKKKEHLTPTIKAYRVTSSWTSSGITWNNRPGYTSTNASDTISLYSGDWYSMDVTALVRNWINGTYTNYGFVLKEPSETDSAQKTKFYSSDAPSPNKPELVINYNTTPRLTFYYDLYRDSSTSTSATQILGYTTQASSDILNAYDVSFICDLRVSTSELNQRAGCTLSTSQRCSPVCGDINSCDTVHHKAGIYFLYKVQTISSNTIISFVDFPMCRYSTDQGHYGVNGLCDQTCKRVIVSLYSDNVQRTTCHEMSHLIGARDGVCTTGQECVMRYGSSVTDEWCDQCQSDILAYIESLS